MSASTSRIGDVANLSHLRMVRIIKCAMSNPQRHMVSILQKLLESCSLEEIAPYISALRDVHQMLEKAVERGTLSQKEADMVLSNWLTD